MLDALTMDEPNQHRSSGDDDPLPPRCIVDLLDPEKLLGASDVAWIQHAADLAMGELGCRGEVRVRVVGDAEMAGAHERHAGIPGTTDVLTFDLRDDLARASQPETLDVDIMICSDEAERRGNELGHGRRRELLLYIVHGVLHCLGHDDHDDEAYARMHAAEDELLERIGVGRTFAPTVSASNITTTRESRKP
jgi:probable rRNA maturation factor